MKERVLVTSYFDPDLDGIACIISYSELLKKKGIDVTPVIVGKPHREAQFLFEKYKMEPPSIDEEEIKNFDKVILVDASDTPGLPKQVDPKRVTQIIDHRSWAELDAFPNAESQVELVGAAATLITEKFMEFELYPSKNSSILLYAAIISNTVNFKTNNTTDRDRKAGKWLKEILDLPDNFVRDVFLEKSNLEGKDLREILIQDYKRPKKSTKKRCGIFQLEILDLENTLRRNKEKISEILEEFRSDQNLDYIFLTGVDLEKGFNMFVAIDDETKKLLEKSLGVKFDGNLARREGILMRKEIVPMIEEYMEK